MESFRRLLIRSPSMTSNCPDSVTSRESSSSGVGTPLEWPELLSPLLSESLSVYPEAMPSPSYHVCCSLLPPTIAVTIWVLAL